MHDIVRLCTADHPCPSAPAVIAYAWVVVGFVRQEAEWGLVLSCTPVTQEACLQCVVLLFVGVPLWLRVDDCAGRHGIAGHNGCSASTVAAVLCRRLTQQAAAVRVLLQRLQLVGMPLALVASYAGMVHMCLFGRGVARRSSWQGTQSSCDADNKTLLHSF